MTTEITEQSPEFEVKNPTALIAKNKELLRELAETKATLQTTQQSLEAAQKDQKTWRDRWYQTAVMAPLEADLKAVSAGPWKYLRDTVMELGLLKMQPDAEGIECPAWFNENDEPADLSAGLYKFLSDVYGRTGNELGHVLRASGTSGGGSKDNWSRTNTPPTSAQVPAAVPMQLGLR